jgi:hypothetical protein
MQEVLRAKAFRISRRTQKKGMGAGSKNEVDDLWRTVFYRMEISSVTR